MSDYLILSLILTTLLLAISFIQSLKLSVCILIFLIPFSRGVIDSYFGASILFLPISAVFLAIWMQETFVRKTSHIPKPLAIILYFFCFFHFASLLKFWIYGSPADVYPLTNDYASEMWSHTLNVLIGIAFAWMISKTCKSTQDVGLYIGSLLASIVFLYGILIITNVLNVAVPSIFEPFYIVTGYDHDRYIFRSTNILGNISHYFGGYQASHENFAEYLFIIFVLSITIIVAPRGYFYKYRPLLRYFVNTVCYSILGLMPFLAYIVANKAFYFMVVLWCLFFVIFAKQKLNSIFPILLGGVIILLLFVFLQPSSDSRTMKNFSFFFDRMQGIGSTGNFIQDLELIFGREGLISMIGEAFRVAGVFGGMPFVPYEFKGTVIPYHNGYYQILLNYGIVGLLLLFYILIKALRGLLPALNNNFDNRVASCLLSLFLVLSLEQMKVSIFRMTPSLLIFFFLISIATVCVRLIQQGEISVIHMDKSYDLYPKRYFNKPIPYGKRAKK